MLELNLGFVLLLPWYLILTALFLLFPRGPRAARVRLFELASVAVAIGASVAGGIWGFRHADLAAGAIWKQVLASLIGYGVFLLVLGLAVGLRRRLLARR
nr:hypothetical protein [Chiayiivirga flava]